MSSAGLLLAQSARRRRRRRLSIDVYTARRVQSMDADDDDDDDDVIASVLWRPGRRDSPLELMSGPTAATAAALLARRPAPDAICRS